MSETADLLRAIAGLSWVLLAALVAFPLFRLLRSQNTPLTKFGLGPTGVTMEFAAAKLNQAVSSWDQQTRMSIGDAAKRSVLDRLQAHANLVEKARILWVDDHPENNEPIADLLRHYGSSVDTPRSNLEALALLDATRYDVIISDVGRDDEGPNSGLKGVELATAVFERLGERLILFTARFDPARLPGTSDQERLKVVSEVRRCVFATTNRSDELLHYILDLLER